MENNQPSQENSAPPNETGPPAPSSNETSSATPAENTPTPTVTVEQPTENGQINAVILKNVEADSIPLDLVSENIEGSATLVTDKADYAPTDTALISGSGFNPGEIYTLIISSTDEPPVNFEAQVTADENGTFVYAYQLDGNYRPNYKVEVFLGGSLIASTMFTDSPISETIIDSAGANDEPGQKDLTKMYYNYTNVPASMDILWDWDDTGWDGSNTGDACSLFDTDNDGYANYALCVTVHNTPAVYQSKGLYSCDDSKADRCPNSVSISPINSSCLASVQATDPFSTGDFYPNDTVASCTVTLSEVGDSSAKLLDVCSFPSQQPNSDPSDCIVASTANQTGFLEVKKILSPTDDSGLFNLQIDGNTDVYDATNNSSTGEKVVDATSHTVGETQGTGTLLSNYSASIVCKDGNGTGTIVATTGTNPWTLTVGNGKDIVCTITNTRINNGSITIVKDANPNDAQDFSFTTTGGLSPSSFNLDDDSDPTLSNTQVFSNLTAGTYSVSETAITGWDQTSAVCDDGSLVSAINLTAGGHITCIFTNTKFGKIIVEKQTNPDGSPQAFTFNPSWGSSFQLTDGQTYDSGFLMPGSYSMTETVPDDWKQQSISCTNGDTDGSFNLQAGETVTCTFTNTQYGSISGKKFIDENGDGVYNPGTEGIVTWSFYIDTNNNGVFDNGVDIYTTTTGIPASYSFTGLNPGQTYVICEVPNSNYYQTLPGTGCYSVAAQASVNLIRDFGNAPKGNIIVKKVMVGGTDSFIFTGDVAGTISSDNGTLEEDNVLPEQYTSIESAKSGWDLTDITCDDTTNGKTASTGDISTGTAIFNVDPGETVTCTFTNTQRGHIIVDKVTDPTSSTQSFDFTVTGLGYSNFSLTNAATPNNQEVVPGAYSVTETAEGGWDSSVVCSDGSSNTAIDISAGENVTCTFTNTMRGAIGGYKYNDADGDIATTGDRTGVAGWTIFIDANGNGTLDTGELSTTTASNGTYGFGSLTPGTYKIGEVLQTGWDRLYPPLSGDDFITVTLDPGENDFSNNFINTQLASVTVFKDVDTDGDGDIDISHSTDWIWDIDGVGNYATGSVISNFHPGTYIFSEDQQSGYHVTSLICNNGITNPNQNYGAVESQSIPVSSGQNLICTFTNTQDTGTLIVKKVLVNDNGGTKNEVDFSFKVNGGADTVFEADGQNDLTVNAGTYSVTEPAVSGYSTSYDNCSGVVITNGGSATCIITNNDQAGTLTVIKHVINDNGGNKVAGDFDITVIGNSPSPASFDGVESPGTTVTLNAGLYNVTENGHDGYSDSYSTDCTGTMTIGGSKTCTITNDDIEPSLTLIKSLTKDNGGTAVESEWTLTATGPSGFSGVGPSVSNGTSFAVGTYDLSESGGPLGYTASDWVCTGGTQVDGDTVTIALGQNVICTITNDDIAPSLTLVKVVTTDDGGTAVVDDFQAYIDDNSVSWGQPQTLGVGSYTVSEDGLAGYTASEWSGDCDVDGNVSLAEGENKTCYITNDDIAPTLTLIKTVVIDNGGDAVVDDFQAYIDDEPVDWDQTQTLVVGDYVVSEDELDGYAASVWSGDCDGQGNVSLTEGENKTCYITNDDIAPILTLVKYLPNDNGGTATQDDFNVYIDGQPAVWGENTTTAGRHTISEDPLTGYTPSAWNTDCAGDGTITLLPGENKTCDITNDDIAPTITLIKNVINDNGGTAGENDFGLTIGDTSVNSGETLEVDANTPYALNETLLYGYSFVEITGDEKCPSGLGGGELGGTIPLDEGENITCIITNDDVAPTLTLVKTVANNTGNKLASEWTLSAIGEGGFSGNGVQDAVENKASLGPNNVKAGIEYVLSESFVSGYVAGDWSCDGGNQTDDKITLELNDDVTCIINNTEMGGFDMWKYEDTDAVLGRTEGVEYWIGDPTFTFRLYRETLGLWEFITQEDTNSEGKAEFNNVFDQSGSYFICEVEKEGWANMKSLYNPANNNSGAGDEYPVCDQLIIDNINYRASLEQGNIRYGSVLVTKFNDLNGNTVWDEGEEVLPDWEIKLSSVSGESTKITQSNGEASFIDLLPGSYDLSENIESQPGWKQTGIYCGDRMPMTIVEQEPLLTSLFGVREVLAVAWDGGGEPVTVNPGQTTNCYIGNRIEKIALTLDKTHDKMGMTASRGDILNFTLTVANTEEGTAYNVTVQDSLPDGFSYVAGSGKVEGVTFVP
ncbi:MAG: hypothetical protein COX44_01285, partial [Candidatus Portnoybacteria bacterium CG23_combo_of_CG06-09_8_20_14_all_37_13]